MNDKDNRILVKITEHISSILKFVSLLDYEKFRLDDKTVSASAHLIGQIGELTNRLTPAIIAANPDIEWNGIRGLRNRVYHDYENVDLYMLWQVITEDLPDLLLRINKMLEPV